MKRFGVMLDCSRNAIMKVQEVKKLASILKKSGYNTLLLYTEDTYEVDNEPYFGYMRGRYSKDEIKEVVAYCNSLGMEVIPCIQTLAHLNQIFRWADYGQINDTADILLIGENRTYELIDNMFKTLRECFNTEYVHIGMDEAHMLGFGKYFDKHGFEDRLSNFTKHLNTVISIAEKYNFKPIMWSDMFFRISNKGDYYPENPDVPADVLEITPKQVGLVYWDYYHTVKSYYDKMFSAHKKFGNEVWFAGGAWVWTGFAPNNQKTNETMIPAMCSARENTIDNVFITLWGDNGKECSFYSVLPALFAIKRLYDGETDMVKIKKEFKEVVGEDFDCLSALDLPNIVGDTQNQSVGIHNPSKYMLYSDPFNGYLDATVKDDVADKYEEIAKKLEELSRNSKYSYIFESEAALCRLLAVKYPLGKKTREAYKAKDKTALAEIIKEYDKAKLLLSEFYRAFKNLWFKENKPHGFDVQDLRLGGLVCRLNSCRERLEDYVNGKIDCIAELDEELLPFNAFGAKGEDGDSLSLNNWLFNASVNII